MNESEMTKLTTKNSFQGVKRRLKYVLKKKRKTWSTGDVFSPVILSE